MMIISLKKYIFIVFIIARLTSFAQEPPVRLLEDKQKKRTIIYVQNYTNLEKSVFLKVNPKGFRRSAQRPVIKNIPANSKVQMLILIPLTDVESQYTYNLVVNEKLETIDVDRNKKKEAPVSSIMRSEVIIFTKKDCEKCALLISKLKDKHIKFREVNIDTKNRYRDYLWQLLSENDYNKNSVGVPLAITKGKMTYPIDDLDAFVASVLPKKD